MAKKIRLIDDTVETVGDAAIAPLTESPKGDTIGSALAWICNTVPPLIIHTMYNLFTIDIIVMM